MGCVDYSGSTSVPDRRYFEWFVLRRHIEMFLGNLRLGVHWGEL
jgi:hypothetical protein